ncbi:hypothetical protein AGABI2DRAFT_118993 [Agaricus bisporus var. bisporus H97]|uniref:hypothetical protein n=1 Tax=Agaricus bisporus var. bisporus (strain H97 / ATCC MYA-4626 / FGSC 10389) TaxID=936046 RepID=UPI00029F7D60|nr:hypothetical protein AGABI2DRAFT_118993 [Agaricus bisporus var. bisporus H97]EKV46814.1 hypothetical protein AGABI2DRAFT_118993 [Agaricus bisporus var. bisporus H97]
MSLGHHKSNAKVYGRHARNLYTSCQNGLAHSMPSLLRSKSDIGPDPARLRQVFSAQGPIGALDIASLSSSAASSTISGQLGSKTLLQTPLPTEATGSEVFKLGGSRPVPDTPGHEFSPVPPIRDEVSENTAIGILISKASQYKAHISSLGPQKPSRLGLASPFVSRPSSPSGGTPHKENSPQIDVNQNSSRAPRDRSGLSDRGTNSNGVPLLPAHNSGSKETRLGGTQRQHAGHRPVISQSARTSPTRDDRGNQLANHLRRPSAPSLRPPMAVFDVPSAQTRWCNTTATGDDDFNLDPENTALITHVNSYVDLSESETYFASSLGSVDFNRPPSQMSVRGLETNNEYAGDDFFAHIRGRSTPHRGGCFLDLLDPTSGVTRGLDDRSDQMRPNSVVHTLSSEERSLWVSDSIISPPSYYARQKKESALEANIMENARDEMNRARSSSPQGVASVLINSVIDTAAIGDSVGTKEPRLKPILPKLRTLGLPVTQTLNMKTTYFIVEDSENNYPEARSHGVAVARNGTLNQGSSTGGRTAGRRNRSDTIVQGGGGARRTRSGTVVQANRVEQTESGNSEDDEPQGEEEIDDESCSCRSSDDELLLRSHSHLDVEAVDLTWKVADPPSPVQRRLRRAERIYEKKKKRRQNGRNGQLGKAVEGIEGGMEDLGVDELDLLGSFLPGDW